MTELQGWRRPSVDDNLTREERARYRQRQSEILNNLGKVREEQEEALEEFAHRQGYDTDDVGERIDARNDFLEKDIGSDFEKRCDAELDALKEEYLSFICQRFETPSMKRRRIES